MAGNLPGGLPDVEHVAVGRKPACSDQIRRVPQRRDRSPGSNIPNLGAVLTVGRYRPAAIEFLDRFATGEDLKRGNPILLLRRKLDALHKERLKRDRGQKKIRGGVEDDDAREPAHIIQSALTILAFNARKSGRTLQTLVWRGVAAEGFPAIDATLLDRAMPARGADARDRSGSRGDRWRGGDRDHRAGPDAQGILNFDFVSIRKPD